MADKVYYHRGDRFTPLSQSIPQLKPFYTDFEDDYNTDPILTWMGRHWEVPIIALALYVALITAGPTIMARSGLALNLRYPIAVWHALLSVFSFVGMQIGRAH